jgi:hypothetical protein
VRTGQSKPKKGPVKKASKSKKGPAKKASKKKGGK